MCLIRVCTLSASLYKLRCVCYIFAEPYEDVIAESIPSPSESSNQMGIVAQPKATIDGNVDLQDAPQSATVVPNKIKINITKGKAQQQQQAAAASSNNDGEPGDGGSNGVNTNNFNEDSQGVEDEASNDGGGAGGSLEERDEKNGAEQSNNKESSTVATPPVAADAVAEVAFEETTDVAYELKEGLLGIELNRQPRVTSGLEASGLCSIM